MAPLREWPCFGGLAKADSGYATVAEFGTGEADELSGAA